MIRDVQKNELEEVSLFLSKMNGKNEHHIGYCGTNSLEIYEALEELFLHVTSPLLVVKHEGNIVGVLGADMNEETKEAEMWGPWVMDKKWLTPLWLHFTKEMEPRIHTYTFFVNKENDTVHTFLNEIGASQQSEQAVLDVQKRKAKLESYKDVSLFCSSYAQDFITLHNTLFPVTYYSGEAILKQLNENHVLFIMVCDQALVGYVYVEADPNYGEGSIEYIGVQKQYEGKGYAQKLLTHAITWLFSFDTINELSLCVNLSHKRAISLYEKVGFQIKHELSVYRKNKDVYKQIDVEKQKGS
ncbi:GNAT family N-acetyltransferase [Metabacillus iocasae]|uniref:Ribosomal protein S18 acetylase RimI-like enzyme n=1 Tax=Priestia iocasae TaxID=2291674 RepID=A0ABS2QX08_9BACI|nr:GNAT family N-acetyltransferase [Metabacillus iocasae]MBM7703952.1 ribosomal protein S18 acetylase RimI-like enzyme [Metabacillus iocasae]